MIKYCLMLLLAAGFLANAAVLAPKKEMLAVDQPTCHCTVTVTEYRSPRVLRPRQSTCPPPSTVTITVFSYPILPVTMAFPDPASVSSVFSYDSQIDSALVLESYQDRPTGEPPETTPLFFTHTASGPAIVGTETPGASFYNSVYSTNIPVSVTTVSFPPAATVTTVYSTTYTTIYQATTTYYTTTTTVPGAARHEPTSAPGNGSIKTSGLEKRQTCSMVFAQISGGWASWCGNWDGHTTVSSYSTYETTVLETTPIGASPIPESVYDPSGTLKSTPLSASTSSTDSRVSSGPYSTTQSVPASGISIISSDAAASSTVITATVVITEVVPTVTETVYGQPGAESSTSSAPEASSSCGQVGDFLVMFDDLPPVSTTDPNNITDAPPIWDRYDHFYWSSGYGFAPPPRSNYTAVGGIMAEFNPADAAPVFNDTQGRDLPGSFGAGQRITNNIYWFDATSVYLGCNNSNPRVQCYIAATGYRWTTMSALDGSIAGAEEIVADAQNFTIPPCVFPPCMLTQVYFDADKFTGLSTINFQAYAGDEEVGFFLDSFDLTWANNSCAAGLARLMTRK